MISFPPFCVRRFVSLCVRPEEVTLFLDISPSHLKFISSSEDQALNLSLQEIALDQYTKTKEIIIKISLKVIHTEFVTWRFRSNSLRANAYVSSRTLLFGAPKPAVSPFDSRKLRIA
jgi:hypothetical protein